MCGLNHDGTLASMFSSLRTVSLHCNLLTVFQPQDPVKESHSGCPLTNSVEGAQHPSRKQFAQHDSVEMLSQYAKIIDNIVVHATDMMVIATRFGALEFTLEEVGQQNRRGPYVM